MVPLRLNIRRKVQLALNVFYSVKKSIFKRNSLLSNVKF